MQAPFDNIVQHLFHQPSLQSVTVDELERMADQHPYFAAAHFLLLKKMQDTDHPQFTTQLHKTTLYFHNPLWLQFLLQPETVTDFTVSEKPPFINSELPAYSNQTSLQEAAPVYAEATADQTATSNDDQAASLSSEQGGSTGQEGMMDVITAVFNPPADVQNPPPVETVFTEPEVINTSPQQQTENEPAGLPADAESDYTSQETTTREETAPDEALPAITAEATEPATIEDSGDPDDTGTLEPAAIQLPDTAPAGPLPAAFDNTALGEFPVIKTLVETPAAKDDLLFEPYHTVDYFASQGIKLSKAETDSKDKLGRQLKSFTEWLKTMKKLPQVSIDKILAQNEESKVVEDAIHSLENKEVITEAMAEVFEKQGLNEKATEIYQKLSLLNPGKSAYFAAKIDVLKH